MTGGSEDYSGDSTTDQSGVSIAASQILKDASSMEEVWGKLLAMGHPPDAIASALGRLKAPDHFVRPSAASEALDQQVILLGQMSTMEGMVAESDHASTAGRRAQSELETGKVLVLGSSPTLAGSVRDQFKNLGVSDLRATSFDMKTDIEAHSASVSDAIAVFAQVKPALVVCCTRSGSRDLADVVNRAAIERNVTALYHHVQGFQVQTGPLVIPGETACYECFKLRREASLAPWERALLRASDNTGELSVTLGVDWLVVDALKYLTKLGEPVSRGRVLFCDYFAGLPEVHTLLRIPRCPVCRVPERPPVKLWNEPA